MKAKKKSKSVGVSCTLLILIAFAVSCFMIWCFKCQQICSVLWGTSCIHCTTARLLGKKPFKEQPLFVCHSLKAPKICQLLILMPIPHGTRNCPPSDCQWCCPVLPHCAERWSFRSSQLLVMALPWLFSRVECRLCIVIVLLHAADSFCICKHVGCLCVPTLAILSTQMCEQPLCACGHHAAFLID